MAFLGLKLGLESKNLQLSEESRDEERIIVYLRAELTVLELLAELLKGLVTSVLLVTFLAIVLGIFSIVFLFSVGFLQASTMIYRPSFRKLRAISFEFISEFASGFTL